LTVRVVIKRKIFVSISVYVSFDIYGHNLKLKANSSWNPTRAKFYQLIAGLSVVLFQLNLTKLKLQYMKSGFRCNNKSYKDS